MKKLNFVDIFSGAGGLSCGLELSGMRCLLGVDHNKAAIDTFMANHKHAQSYCGDITKLTPKLFRELTNDQTIHAVVGGPPCQGFSTVGRGIPTDERNTLFKEFVRIVRISKPYFIIMENVTGLLAKKNEKTLKSIFSLFKKYGYLMDVKMMSADLYGVPEKRRRTIFIGSRINQEIIFPKPICNTNLKGQYIPSVTIGEAFQNLKTTNGLTHNHDLENATIKSKIDLARLKRIPEGKGIRYQKDEIKYLSPSLRLNIDWENIPESRFRQTKYLRLSRSLPSPTIMTHRHGYYHPTEHRYLTQREAAKIQSFPNDFVFKGTISAQWRQIGNAVPPLLAKHLGKTLQKMYRLAKKDNTSKPFKTNNHNNLKNAMTKVRGNAFCYQEKKSNEI